MGSTVKEIVVRFCERTGVPVPATVFGSTDAQVIQMRALLNEELDELIVRENFAPLQRECTFISIAAEFQGTLETILPSDDTMWKVCLHTFYDRTNHLVVEGPISQTEWQQYKALQAGMLPRFRFWNNGLYLQPIPPAGHTYAFEYLSQNLVVAADSTYKRYFTTDTDTCLADDSILASALRWRWKKEKGLDYSEEFSSYERIRASYFVTAGMKPVLNLAETLRREGPGIVIPPGSWLQP